MTELEERVAVLESRVLALESTQAEHRKVTDAFFATLVSEVRELGSVLGTMHSNLSRVADSVTVQRLTLDKVTVGVEKLLQAAKEQR